jgi:flagellar biosynthesis/type III secretory pathway protein FliH
VHESWKTVGKGPCEITSDGDEFTRFFRRKTGRVDDYLRAKRGVGEVRLPHVTEVDRHLNQIFSSSPRKKAMQSIDEALEAIEQAKAALQDAEDQISAERTESYDEGYEEGCSQNQDPDDAFTEHYEGDFYDVCRFVARRAMKDMMDRRDFSEELLFEVLSTQLQEFLEDPPGYLKHIPPDLNPYRGDVPADFCLVERYGDD